ncbi:hypothetical protein GCM10010313_81620 [Streptomyces violarus]|uniref:DNA-binding Lrp family transcriptional regulator n=2 Tax=Streptomyces violarus TaxID=67380 RepID=A0A7W4ZZK6_9ACTN|nr:DNA-binding Lrp family transcriptional regulator [Streptomyces violarus]GHD34770.1 hypothetical protein GCM10010313_81620 [Streptomyces violarus]
MMQLRERGPMRQTHLARRRLGTDAATMTRTIQRLEKTGIVRRTRSTSDNEDYAVGGFTDDNLTRPLAVLERLETDLAAQTGCADPPPRPGTSDA